MRNRIRSVGCALTLLISMLLISVSNVKAAADTPILDGSYLTHDDEAIGYDSNWLTRGEHLLVGYSKCVKQGPGKIYAGGTTIATHTVDSIKIAVIVERAKKGDTSWEYFDSWQKENQNTDRVGSNRLLLVEGGYYYRVRCLHAANGDASSSFTDGVYVE